MSSAPRFFSNAAEFSAWLALHHATATELIVGYYKKATSKPSMTWSESVDEALCYGWIDGVRRSLDEERYTIRFTPRKSKSVWSNVNIGKAEALIREGRMKSAGRAAWALRDPARSGIYSFEREKAAELEPAMQRVFKRNRAAWTYFHAQPPGYRRLATHWVMSAKRPETRVRRLAGLIEHSAHGERLPQTLSAGRKSN